MDQDAIDMWIWLQSDGHRSALLTISWIMLFARWLIPESVIPIPPWKKKT